MPQANVAAQGFLCRKPQINKGGKDAMAILNGKKVVIIGDRDGIPGPSIEACVKTAGADVVFSSTECFV